jgi:hypothetical protein
MNRTDPITAETRVGALLDAWPELEDTLVALSPRFEKLRNPLLRRTVAKVATLEKAAAIGGVSVRDVVRALRSAAGQDLGEPAAAPAPDATAAPAPAPAAAETPAWVRDGVVVHEVDADAMLAKDVHPLVHVRTHAAQLTEGQLLRLDVSFRPVPLLDVLTGAGHPVHVQADGPLFRVYVGPRRAS